MPGNTLNVYPPRGPVKPFQFNDPPTSISLEGGEYFQADTGSGQFTLQDPAGKWWMVGVTDQGLLTTSATPQGNTIYVVLNDLQQTASWVLGVDMNGELNVEDASYASYPVFRFMGSNTMRSIWGLGVTTAGLLFTQPTPTAYEDSYMSFTLSADR